MQHITDYNLQILQKLSAQWLHVDLVELEPISVSMGICGLEESKWLAQGEPLKQHPGQ